MNLFFTKYQGAGNDFILLNNLSGEYDGLTDDEIRFVCDRKFGVGADGLIKINSSTQYDYEVDYYNADASKSFCGNGGRCAVAFAFTLDQNYLKGSFLGYDGVHSYSFENDQVRISMRDVDDILYYKDAFELYTGSPHFVKWEENLKEFPVEKEGKAIRFSERYEKDGINVNFAQIVGANELEIRTYERGVEAETLACGTGVTACAIAYAYERNLFGEQRIACQVLGGQLFVEFTHVAEKAFEKVALIGPAVMVFKGVINLD